MALKNVNELFRWITEMLKGDEEHEPMTLADFAGKEGAGKTLLVNLWATWCAPCRAEMPALDALQKEMGGDRFEVVAVNVDTGDAFRTYVDEHVGEALAKYFDGGYTGHVIVEREGSGFRTTASVHLDTGIVLQA